MVIDANYNGSNYDLGDRLGNIEDSIVSILSLQSTANTDISALQVQALGGDPLDLQALGRISTLETSVTSLEGSVEDLEDVAEEWVDVGGLTKSTYSTYVQYQCNGVSGNTDYLFSIVLKRTVDDSITRYYSWAGERNTDLSVSTRIIFDSVGTNNLFGYLYGGSSNIYLQIFDMDGSTYTTDEVELLSLRVKMPV